jgi:hypothetical protein
MCLRGQLVEGPRKRVFWCASGLLHRAAFQACSFNHSDISPFRINHLRVLDRAESDLCPGLCPNPVGVSTHLNGYPLPVSSTTSPRWRSTTILALAFRKASTTSCLVQRSTRFGTEGRLFESRFSRFTGAVLADASDM